MTYSSSVQKELVARSKAYLEGDARLLAQSPAIRNAQLREMIVFHEWRYYIKNDPVLSDFEYDHLYKMLEALELDYPDLITTD